MLGGETRLVALIGDPVAGSLSPRMQNAAFAARGLDWAYVACRVEATRLEEAVRGLVALGFAGANVTAPHKQAVVALCDELDDAVHESGSANTLVVRDGLVRASSTDARILAGERPSRAAVIGAGGAAAAFEHALRVAGVTVERFSRQGRWPPTADGVELVVNATPVRDEVLVELRPGQTLVDLPYPESATADAARAVGAHVFDGLDVLVAQGAASFELWTGASAPSEVMRAAVRDGSGA
jgi:shikimate dehydrogenase